MITIKCIIQFEPEDGSFDQYEKPEDAERMLHDALCRGFQLLRSNELAIAVEKTSVLKDDE